MAGKEWSGSPKRSRLSGCTWYSRFAVAAAGSLRAKAPRVEGAIVIGPRRNSAYSSAMPARERRLAEVSLSVRAFETL